MPTNEDAKRFYDALSQRAPAEVFMSPDAEAEAEAEAEDFQRHKADAGKLRFDLRPPLADRALIEVLTFGLRDHEEESWRNVELWRYRAALERHLNAYYCGDYLDADSGKPHLWHALANLAFMVELDIIAREAAKESALGG